MATLRMVTSLVASRYAARSSSTRRRRVAGGSPAAAVTSLLKCDLDSPTCAARLLVHACSCVSVEAKTSKKAANVSLVLSMLTSSVTGPHRT